MKQVGDLGIWAGAIGIFAFTTLFLVATRWWTDVLGRTLAAVFVAASGVLCIASLRSADVELIGGIMTWRAVCYVTCGGVMWAAGMTCCWAQWCAPRRRGAWKGKDLP